MNNSDHNLKESEEKSSGNIVYVLTNEAMPGYTKIGITNDLKKRVKQLSGTSVPVPFEVVAAKRVKNAKDIENKMHAAFAKDRIDSGAGREFFMISAEQAASALSIADGEDIVLDDTNLATEQEKNALAEIRSRRPVFKFSFVKIPPRSVLTFSLDPSIICIVHDDRKVEFKGEVVSLSDAAMQVLKSMDLNWKAVSGPGIWMFEGESLHERRKRFEEEDNGEPTSEQVEKAGDEYMSLQADIAKGK